MNIVEIIPVLCSIITSIIAVVTIIKSNQKIRTELEMRVKSQQHQIEEMKQDIKEHNNYAVEIPVIRTEISYIKEMIGDIKK